MRGLSSLSFVFFTGAFALVATRADADDAIEPLHLTYRANGEGCPDEATFRRDVALRLGIDPFLDPSRDAPRPSASRMTVTIEGARRASVVLADAKGKPVGRRDIVERRASCAEMAGDVAFAASVAIDPTVLDRPAAVTEAPPKQDDAPKTTPPPPRNDGPPPERHDDPRVFPPTTETAVRVAGLAGFGLAPTTGFGVSLGLEAQRTWLSASLAADLLFPPDTNVAIVDATGRSASATLRTTIIAGAIAGCAHFARAASLEPYGCVVARIGQLRGASENIAHPKEASSMLATAGPRVGLRMPATRALAIDASVEVPFALTQSELRIDDRAVWTSATAAAVIAIGARLALQ